jgi:hypothetical protein
MSRTLYLVVAAALLVFTAEARAEKFKATLRSVDAEQRTIRVTPADGPAGKDVEYKVTVDARIIRGNGQKPLPDGLKDKLFQPGVSVTLTTAIRDGVEVVTKVAVYGRAKVP